MLMVALSTGVAGQAAESERIHEVRFHSESLQHDTALSVVEPESTSPHTPVLVFLHGRGRHHRSLLEVEACRAELLAADMWVILPDGEDGWYINSPAQSEARYEDYLSEVIAEARGRFALTPNAERWAIGGWSMGGYGAVHYATRHPEKFSTLVSVIGVIDFPRAPTLPAGQNYQVPVARFGESQVQWQEFNPINAVNRLRGKSILLITATDAFDRTMNRNFSGALNEADIRHDTLELTGGHTFDVVQASLSSLLEFVRTSITDRTSP